MSLPENPSKSHHIGSPPTHFQNPWPSFTKFKGVIDLFGVRFGSQRNFIPVPETRDELVKVQTPTWGHEESNKTKLKATWIGHASWLIEFPATKSTPRKGLIGKEAATTLTHRGVTVLVDPVFADRTSPTRFLGPKRYSPLPCSIADLPDVDIIAISHNHYDHLDYDAILALHRKSLRTHFLVPLKNKAWFVGCGFPEEQVHEFDWWSGATVNVKGVGSIAAICTPAQHTSARTPFDRDKMLWGSWVFAETDIQVVTSKSQEPNPISIQNISKTKLNLGCRVYFAGDTGYRSVENADPSEEEEASKPRCPAFKEIGDHLGPFNLALVPIGLYSPRSFMSNVHACPEDSVCMLQDVKAKRTLGMHYGTFRGGLSGQYEDVREPPRRFEAACKKAGLKWGEEVGLCDIGETVVVD